MTKLQQWVAGTTVVVLATLVGGWFLVVSPKRAQVNALHAKAQASQSQLQTLQSQVAMLTKERQGLPAQQAKINAFSKRIPDGAQLPALVRSLTTAANASGVDLQTLTPSSPVALSTTPTAPATLPSGTAAGKTAAGTPATGAPAAGIAGTGPSATGAPGSLMTVPMQISVRGSYFQLESFVSSLERLQRRFLVTGYTLGPATSSAGSSAGSSAASSAASMTSAAGTSLDLGLTGMAFEVPGAATASPTPSGATASGPTTTAPASTGRAN